MALQIEVINATNIPNPESIGKCDPYTSIVFQGQKKKTQVKKGELNPTWNETLEFDLAGIPLKDNDELTIYISDWERVGRNRQLGITKLPLREFTKGGPVSKTLSVTLEDANQRPLLTVINLKITYTPPAGASQKPKSTATNVQETATGTVVTSVQDEEEEEEDEKAAPNEPPVLDESGQPVKKKGKGTRRKYRGNLSTKPQDFQKMEKGEGGTDGESKEGKEVEVVKETKTEKKESSKNASSKSNKEDVDTGEKAASKEKTATKKSDGKGLGVEKKNRDLIDSSKVTDFKIRVKVIQARQLQGANIQPVTRVSVSNQMRQTRVKKSTNTPHWNESFFFNFHASPAELFEELIEFQVFNSRRLRSDALIGSFKCDIGLVYDQPQHTLLNKWLLLSDPEDAMAGAKGYLKVSIGMLGPGDEAPRSSTFSSSNKFSMKTVENDENEDVESNLLRPAGVQLRPATFKLKVYRAEDIPRMDSAFIEGVKKVFGIGNEPKELVDPYFIFAFAGKEVKTKTVYSCDHPEWNQELRLGLQFPSMCEKIKFVVKDWDRVTEDDTVGTAFLPVSIISSPGENGFLPTFGPCFINFYGSTREYSDLPNEYADLNDGKGEGVAYRGRVLVEMTTEIGELPTENVVDIENDDLLRVQKFLRRRKYRVHAAFLDATMIGAIDAPVEFEISIGNYGNKLDENVPPCASTTQPTNAVFDGCKYYFLPWSGTKPCVVVDCSFEDVSFRLEALNVLAKIINDLESNIERVRIGIKAKLPIPELAQLLISLLDQLVFDCKKALPEARKGVHVANDLDRLLASYRNVELSSITEMAIKLRESATDVTEALAEVETYLQALKSIAVEPQNSMPDVVIWMISGQKRIAYYRIPANDLLYSSDPFYRGKHCGKLQTIQLKYPTQKEKQKDADIPGLLRIKLWLGLQQEESAWHRLQSEGELAVFAETYENQVNILGSWTNKGPTMSRPKWSDNQGKMELPKDQFVPPQGWRWDGDWYVSPELSMLYDKDAGHLTFMDDVYECQSRNIPGGSWGPASRPWADVKGDEMQNRANIKPPEGWEWLDDWQVDINRAVDEEAWEYCVESTVGGFGPVERTYHLCRRRRWVRSRKNVSGVTSKEKAKKEKKIQQAAEGWEYAPLFNMKFHAFERTIDLVRRRRWHRKMVADDPSSSCFFSLKNETEKGVNASLAAPRMFLSFQAPMKYQLRAYIYQARNLPAADDNGLSDPFAQVCFLTQSMVTEKVQKTLCPTWDQTLIFGEIEIYGNPKNLESNPPDVYIELFDYDTFGKAEFLGRTNAQPMVKLDPADARTPVLQWYSLKRAEKGAGELLAAFEIFLLTGKDLPFLPPKRGNLYLVPNGIRPVTQRTGIEVLCWGVRNMKKFQLSNVTSPRIMFECGGYVAQSTIIRDTAKNPNFLDPLLFFDVMLPKEELYMPPMNIHVHDHRNFGRQPTVGVFVLRSLEQFRINPALQQDEEDNQASSSSLLSSGGDHVVQMPVEEKAKKKGFSGPTTLSLPSFSKMLGKSPETKPLKDSGRSRSARASAMMQEELDWWSKYYASTGDTNKCRAYLQLGYYKVKLYKTDLEKVDNYNEFSDFCNTFKLSRGKDDDDDIDDENAVGEFKGTFRVYPLPPDPNEPLPPRILGNFPPSTPEECIVRVYVVRATDLQPNDPSGLADPYIEVVLGKKKINSRDNYIPNTTDPVFGKMFEMTAVIPLDKDLIVRVKDFDLISSDDLIGETVVDLENRFLTKYRATCGIPESYWLSGINQWRDSQKPKEILEEYCRKNRLPAPMFYGNNTAKIGQRLFNLTDFEKTSNPSAEMGPAEERLALHILNTFPIVKEHVELRPLYNPLQPGIEQGKLHMWVDMFPKSIGPPGPPFDITPRKAKKYVLRIIIWNTVDVILEEESITGEKMSDIYVVGWMSGIDEKQKTDIHYRSLDGEGNFNWRFVFPFEFLVAEQVMVIRKKEHFWSLDETEQQTSPLLMIQIWDNDKFSADDFLGTLELNLNSMPKPAKKARACSLQQLADVSAPGKAAEMVSLFEVKRLRGFWPCYSDDSGQRILTGKVEMEFELIEADEAEQRPAGLGRDEPNTNPTLEPPKRPETSFLWFASPLKTLRYIIWRNYKWVIIGFLLLVLLILLLFLFIYSFPGEISRRIVGN